MQDHKTVREAIIELRGYIHRAPAHYNAPYHNDVMRISEQALAALDRIEAVETVTVEELRDEHMKHVQCYGDIRVFEWQRIRYPNGLRIVQAAGKPEQPAAPINQAYEG